MDVFLPGADFPPGSAEAHLHAWLFPPVVQAALAEGLTPGIVAGLYQAPVMLNNPAELQAVLSRVLPRRLWEPAEIMGLWAVLDAGMADVGVDVPMIERAMFGRTAWFSSGEIADVLGGGSKYGAQRLRVQFENELKALAAVFMFAALRLWYGPKGRFRGAGREVVAVEAPKILVAVIEYARDLPPGEYI